MTSRRVPIVTRAGQDAGEAEISFDRDDARCLLQLRVGTLEFSGEGFDYFEALCVVRKALEAHDLLVKTYGGSRYLVLSGMCRDMGAGLKGYRVTLGKPTSRSDLVGIFDTGPDVDAATVDEQRTFGREWLRSIGGKPLERAD